MITVNTLFTGDNLHILNGLNSRSVDLIYLDPPFNSKRFYSAPIGSKAAGTSFKDMWSWQDVNEAYLERMIESHPALVKFIESIRIIHGKPMMAYLTYMTQRMLEMHRVLKDTGSLYLHCDPTASHYLKIIMDRLFGRDNFRNEIVWCYTGPGSPNMRQFNRKHDLILWYSKGNEWTFNKDEVRLPYKDPKQRPRKVFDTGGAFSERNIEMMRERGKVPETWWVDIAIAARSKKENTGYPTQKPLKLLTRIIKASSNEGDVVLDPFCGCATTCVVAQRLGRKWIGIDIEEKSADLVVERLSNDSGLFKDFVHRRDIPVRTDVRVEKPNDKGIKARLYYDQNCLCNGCRKRFDIMNLEVDHVIPKSKGGGDYYENYQLLCGHCNRTKGNKPMEYLRAKIHAREELVRRQISFGL